MKKSHYQKRIQTHCGRMDGSAGSEEMTRSFLRGRVLLLPVLIIAAGLFFTGCGKSETAAEPESAAAAETEKGAPASEEGKDTASNEIQVTVPDKENTQEPTRAKISERKESAENADAGTSPAASGQAPQQMEAAAPAGDPADVPAAAQAAQAAQNLAPQNGQTPEAAQAQAQAPQNAPASQAAQAAPAATVKWVTNCKEFITLRTSPNTSASEITKIPLNASVYYLEPAANNFSRVTYNNQTGYVLSEYLTDSMPMQNSFTAAPQPAQPAPAAGGSDRLVIDGNTLYSGDTAYVVLCDEFITLRAQPDTGAAALARIPLFDAVTFLSQVSSDFSQVRYNGTTGYVLTRYLDYYEPQVFDREMTVYNCSESITLRESPSTSAAEICQIPLGATVGKLYWDNSPDFYYVTYNGHLGYALKKYLH